MSIQWNLRWRAFEMGIFIYWHCCSKRKEKREKTKKKNKKKKNGTVVPVPLLLAPVPVTQKEAVPFWYRYHTNRYRYCRAEKGQIRVFFPILTPFHLLNPPSLYKTNPSPFVLSHEQIRDRTFLPAFSPFRLRFFLVRRTNVVRTPHFFESIFSVVFHCVSMDLFVWLGLVVFCSWWIRASTNGMGRKFLSELNGASPILMEMGCWDIVLCI